VSSPPKISPQRFLNGEIHDWYRTVHGFSDHLVAMLLDRFKVKPGQKVLDAFCGTGTTVVECQKRAIASAGIDASPLSRFVSAVKVNWAIKPDHLLGLLEAIKSNYHRFSRCTTELRADVTYQYLEVSGMLQRGWISKKPLLKTIALKQCILHLRTSRNYRDALLLALFAEVVHGASNAKFGPELYCGSPKEDADVRSGFGIRVESMAKDLASISDLPRASVTLVEGDARECQNALPTSDRKSFSAVICSPPYPAEHDYTRNTRLELALLGMVTDRASLRAIKKRMLRSHTKGIYKGDSDSKLVENNKSVQRIARKLRAKAKTKNHGFAPLYPTVIEEYFGGMKRHLQSLKCLLESGAKCAYVVGDQSAYLQVHVPTASILGELAKELGYRNVEIIPWRNRWSTATSREVHENVLLFENA
jgi:hypothetical protein